MTTSAPVQEGFIRFHGYRIWYRIVGDLSRGTQRMFPLLTLHGGPGATHYGLLPLEKIAETGRAVIFYDQLGCGNSDNPDDPSLWSTQFFLDELASIRRELALEQVHLFGHSWGGMLAMEYMLTQPGGVLSLTLASTVVSGMLLPVEQQRVFEQLPDEVSEILLTQSWSEEPEYQKARRYFDTHHVCRREPWPNFLEEASKKMNVQINMSMWAGDKTNQGELRHWDIRSRLGEIYIPTLITAGAHDGMATRQDLLLQQGMPTAKHVVFENSSHFAHAEETDNYLAVLTKFLSQTEQTARST